jgi:hypothetical protein
VLLLNQIVSCQQQGFLTDANGISINRYGGSWIITIIRTSPRPPQNLIVLQPLASSLSMLWDKTTGTVWQAPEIDPGDGRTLVLEYT